MPIALATCPYKDEANDYAIRDDDARDDNAVWTYEHAKGDVGEIAAHLASYPNQIQIVRAVSPCGTTRALHVSEAGIRLVA